jgi:hypothetical protein
MESLDANRFAAKYRLWMLEDAAPGGLYHLVPK